MKDHFTITSGVLPAETRIASFKGVEALSTPYRFEVNLLVPNEADIELEDVVGDKVTLTLQPDTEHVVSGVIATFELLAEASTYGLFRATIVPKLWYLTLTHHSRVFVNESVKDIIEKILKANDFSTSDYSFKISGTYAKLDHVCQYQESDFNFISRWMEREGLYYFFEHGDSGEVMVITDDKSFHTAKAQKPVRYVPQLGRDASANASLDTFLCRRTTLPTKVALKDYDYLKPKLDVSGSAPVSSSGQGEVHVYGGNFTTPDDGKRLAKLRAEEMLGRQTIYTGEGRVYDIVAGYTFTLSDHPRSAFNVEYLAIAVYHYGNQSGDASGFEKLLDIEHDAPYHVKVEAIPASIQYRPAHTTPIPRIYGTEEAVIDAEDGNVYAEIDAHGRYKVKIFFDETDLEDGKASMWVRMLQPHGGDIEGFHFPLRKGTEVHLVFMGGDPDRPVIAGVAHNAINPSSVTQKNNTKNVMQTGGKNRIEMEDQEGSQWMHMKTVPKSTFLFMGAVGKSDSGKDEESGSPWTKEHNVSLTTEGTGKFETGNNMDILTKHGPMTIKVEGGGTSLHEVTGAVTEDFKDIVTQKFGKQHKITVESGGREEEITDHLKQTVKGDSHLNVEGGGCKLEVGGGWGYNITAGPQWVTKIEGPWHHKSGPVDWNVEEEINITASGNIEFKGKDIKSTRTGNHFEFTLGTSQEIKVGSFTDITLVNKNEVTVGVVSEILVAGGVEIAIAALAELHMGPRLNLRTMKLENVDAEIKKLDAEIKKVDAAVKDAEADIAIHDFTLEQIEAKVYA